MPNGPGNIASDVSTAGFSEAESPIPKMSKEDYVLMLLEEVVRSREAEEGRIERFLLFEGNLAVGADVNLEADFPHDAWVIYARHEWSSTAVDSTLRVMPDGTASYTHGLEIPPGVVLRLKSTSNHLSVYNEGPGAAYYFAVALSLAEVHFDLIAHQSETRQ